MPSTHYSRGLTAASVVAILLAYAALQYWWLPADGFFTGDAGTKYLQAYAVVQHGPLSPWIEGPATAVDPAFQWREPFLLVANGHLVGLFSWLLSLCTAPFLAVFGLRGLYVVPAISIAVLFLAAASLGRAAGEGPGLLSGWCATIATPLAFYGAELWEHAPAIALSTMASALMMPGRARMSRDAALAGLCLAMAAALRPEALWVGPAVLIARIATDGWRSLYPQARMVAAGVIAGGVVIVLGNVRIYGAAVPQQVSSNLQAGYSYWLMRREILELLLMPSGAVALFAAGLIALAVVGLIGDRDKRLLAAHPLAAILLVIAAGIPLWRILGGMPLRASIDPRSLVHTWPACILVAYAFATRPAHRVERTLLAATGIVLALVFITMPHTGGAQWSARFFLPAVPLGAVVGAQLARRRETRVLAVLAIVASIAVQAAGFETLWFYKRVNAQVTRLASNLVKPGEVLASDVFWVPQVTATLYPTRALLFAGNREMFPAIAAAAAARGATTFWIATTVPGSDYPPFTAGEVRSAGLSSLVFQRYSVNKPTATSPAREIHKP